MKRMFCGLLLTLVAGASLLTTAPAAAEPAAKFKVVKSDAEWRKILTPEQYAVLRGKGTERPGSSQCTYQKSDGDYRCAGCNNLLFESEAKFESGTGWPSFSIPREGSIVTEADNSHGMRRVEVMCADCGGHLGHVFRDGPPPTGLRYCINGVALKFVKTAAK